MSESTKIAAAATKISEHLLSLVGAESYDDVTPMAKGIGTKIAAADKTLAEARDTLATLLPVALTWAYLTRVGGAMSDRKAAPFLGVKPDTFGIYVIAGALLGHGVDADEARTAVIAAVRDGASKPALLVGATESVAAFNRVWSAAAQAKADAAAQATESEATESGEATESEATEAKGTESDPIHTQVVAAIGTFRGLAKIDTDDVDMDDKIAVVKAYAALSKAWGLSAVVEALNADAQAKREAKRAQAQAGVA